MSESVRQTIRQIIRLIQNGAMSRDDAEQALTRLIDCPSPWVPIRAVEDLPKEAGEYLWIDSARVAQVEYFNLETMPEWVQKFLAEFVAWMPIPPSDAIGGE